MATALVTGATGFVGSHLVRLLLADGHHVKILRRASSRLDAIQDLDVQHLTTNMMNEEALTRDLQGVDWVFHVAAVADYWRTGKEKIYQVNVDGTRALLNAAENAQIKRFMFTSSVAAVGYTAGQVATEDSYFNVDPRLSPYGHSKFLAEAEVYQSIRRGLDAVILNPAIIIGPCDLNQISGSIILEVKRGVLPTMPQTGGTNYVDVRDVAAAHLAAAQHGRTGERYLIGNQNMLHKTFISLVCDVVGVAPPIIPSYGFMIPAAAMAVDIGRAMGLPIPAEGNQLRLSRQSIYIDITKMETELHAPQIDIRQSIQDTYDWYQANGYL